MNWHEEVFREMEWLDAYQELDEILEMTVDKEVAILHLPVPGLD